MNPEREEAQQDSTLDLEDQLSEEFDRMEAGESEEEIEEVEETAEAEAEEVAEAEAAEEQAVAEEEQQEAEDSGYTEPAPERWPAEMKEVYNQLPPNARKMMMEQVYKPMQAQYTKTTQHLAEQQKTINPMLETMQQYRNDFERMGQDPVEAFRTQVAWAAHFARVGPQQGLKDMQAAYGQTAPEGQQDEPYLTPVERAMKADLDALKQQLHLNTQGQDAYLRQQQEQQQQAYVNGVRNELQSFINEQKDGKPAHPHVEKAAPAIAGIIRGGLISKTDQYGQPVSIRDQMAQAYDMAVRLDPSLARATGDTGQVKRAKAAQEAEVVANNPAGTAEVPEMSIEEQLDAEYDRMARRTG
jgi:hypothetical protein